MPIYEYLCSECKTTFDVRATLAEKEKGLKPKCPKCGSEKTIRSFSRINLISSSQGRNFTPGPSCGPGCACN